MKALVIAPYGPVTDPRNVFGIYKRFDLFVRAIGQFCDRIDILHYVPEAAAAAAPDLRALSERQSEVMGVDVRVALIPLRARSETFWNHYVAGIASLGQQPKFQEFAGPAQVARIGASLASKPDLVLALRLSVMQALRHSQNARRPGLFFDLDDVEHRVRMRFIASAPLRPGKLLSAAQLPAVIAAERSGAAMAELTFVCSEQDQRYLRGLGLRGNVEVVPNALPAPDMPSGPCDEATLLFLGAYHYDPNAQAAERLVSAIWPLVRARVPQARLLIAGEGSDRLPCFRHQPPGVEFLGFVDSLPALYRRSRIVCCTIMVGGGTRVKLIEAASYAKPIVSTRVGAEGLLFEEGSEILRRDDDQSFADACVALLRDDAACARMGMAARARMLALYERSAVQNRLAALMQARL